jgi:phytoene dehydrogenase-like protein
VTYDAVVVGAGPNGLVAANLLADEGRAVLLLEASDAVGGGCRTAELTLPGFLHDVCSAAHPLAAVSPVLGRLRLADHGLVLLHGDGEFAHPFDDAPSVVVSRSLGDTVAALGPAGSAWRRLVRPFTVAGPDLVATVLDPLAFPRAPLAATAYASTALLPATIGARLMPTEAGRAMLGGLAAHSMQDLGAPLTTGFAVLLGALAHLGGWPVVEGGSQRLADALAARLLARGGQIRTGVRVDSLRDLPPARRILLDVTPRQALAVLGADAPPGYRRSLARYRYGPGVFKVDWALDGPIPWRDPSTAIAPTVHLGGTFDEIAASERAVATGQHADRPYVLLVQATVVDPSRAPAGKHVAWAYCHVPHGSRVDRTAAIEGQVERFAPGFRDLVIGRHTMDTAQLEVHDANYVGGDIGAGVVDVRQILRRPVLSLRPWRTPVAGVYLSSAATPPGPGVHGMCGWRAARTVLEDDDRGRPGRRA